MSIRGTYVCMYMCTLLIFSFSKHVDVSIYHWNMSAWSYAYTRLEKCLIDMGICACKVLIQVWVHECMYLIIPVYDCKCAQGGRMT